MPCLVDILPPLAARDRAHRAIHGCRDRILSTHESSVVFGKADLCNPAIRQVFYQTTSLPVEHVFAIRKQSGQLTTWINTSIENDRILYPT